MVSVYGLEIGTWCNSHNGSIPTNIIGSGLQWVNEYSGNFGYEQNIAHTDCVVYGLNIVLYDRFHLNCEHNHSVIERNNAILNMRIPIT